MKNLKVYLEGLCQSSCSYWWGCLHPLGGDFLETHTPMHYSSQGWSVVADQGDRARWKELNRLATPADQWWCVINLYVTRKVSYWWKVKVKGLKHRFEVLIVLSGTLYWGSIMPRYVRADLQNRCSFHSSHHYLYDWVMKRAGIQADRSTSLLVLCGNWAVLIHSTWLVIVSLGFITSA